MFQKILVPVDGSEGSVRAAEYAADLARRYSAAVTLLFVADPGAVAVSPLPEAVKAQFQAAMREANEQMLASVARVFEGAEVQCRQLEGSPGRMIAAEADSGACDLIVMGSRGLGQRDDQQVTMGSVADRVLRRVRCPVLVVKE
jgi:nucleotide-binding universal stress UspA family protein